jgi:hypothetical protein
VDVSPQELRHPQAWVLPLSRTLLASFLVINVVLSELRRDLLIRQDEISSYLVGDYRWLAGLSFVLLSAGGAHCWLPPSGLRASGRAQDCLQACSSTPPVSCWLV